ncbi:DUF3152 domain-containing protein [Streptomyces kebangsaanensis]|uniref:DUF3152 domain-containing protein n=1 Tax=Streptomyces kebangsaanensis TaxID=864058 RepID=UPI00093D38FB|nr:DUF3152 domain-containing protein [Streptomyces kebangsaanensis]
MGRHSRRGPAPRGKAADTTAARDGRVPRGHRKPRQDREPGDGPGEAWDGPDPWDGRSGRPGPGAAPESRRETDGLPPPWPGPGPVPGGPAGAGGPAYGTSARRAPHFEDGTPARGVPRFPEGTPARGGARRSDGTPAQGVPWPPDGTPARGVPGFADGTPARGVPRFPEGTPARGVPRHVDGTPAHGAPRLPDGTPAPGVPRVRGGHPEQHEAGGGWGHLGADAAAGQGPPAAGPGAPRGAGASAGARAPVPRQRKGAPAGPRQEYLDAFGEDDVFTPRLHGGVPSAHPAVVPPVPPAGPGVEAGRQPTGEPAPGTGTKGRTLTGIAAAAVTTVLAVVVAGQVADDRSDADVRPQSAADRTDGGAAGIAGIVDDDGKPAAPPDAPTLTYGQKMGMRYVLSPALKGSGRFDAVPGSAKAPGKGRKYTYRVDVEQGLGLDGELFAQAVHKTLNDDRSWAHDGDRTFERVSSGKSDFVITLASPGTTAVWCAKSGLDTTEDNVSCDSAATERVMINAYRWAQGSKTYGDEMYAYRQMLINHEIGHRLGYGHVTCDRNGALAPVMQQQTKFLDHDGIHCLPNPWPYPES